MNQTHYVLIVGAVAVIPAVLSILADVRSIQRQRRRARLATRIAQPPAIRLARPERVICSRCRHQVPANYIQLHNRLYHPASEPRKSS